MGKSPPEAYHYELSGAVVNHHSAKTILISSNRDTDCSP